MDLKGIIDLIDDKAERIIISPECDPDTWVCIPCDSPILTEEVLAREVENIGARDNLIQVWLAD